MTECVTACPPRQNLCAKWLFVTSFRSEPLRAGRPPSPYGEQGWTGQGSEAKDKSVALRGRERRHYLLCRVGENHSTATLRWMRWIRPDCSARRDVSLA